MNENEIDRAQDKIVKVLKLVEKKKITGHQLQEQADKVVKQAIVSKLVTGQAKIENIRLRTSKAFVEWFNTHYETFSKDKQ